MQNRVREVLLRKYIRTLFDTVCHVYNGHTAMGALGGRVFIIIYSIYIHRVKNKNET